MSNNLLIHVLPPFINSNKLLDLLKEGKDEEDDDRDDDDDDRYRDFWCCIIFLIFSFWSSVLINQWGSSSFSSVISDDMLSIWILRILLVTL